LSGALICVVNVHTLFYAMGKMTRNAIMHKLNSLSHYKWYIL